MIIIKEYQTLELENLISFRGKILQNEIQQIGNEMEHEISINGCIKKGNPITAIYNSSEKYIDIEILIPLDKPLDVQNKFSFKKKILIDNAVVGIHKGNPQYIDKSYNELNEYIINKGLVPITAAYNFTRVSDSKNIENTEIDIYVGINPNIL